MSFNKFTLEFRLKNGREPTIEEAFKAGVQCNREVYEFRLNFFRSVIDSLRSDLSYYERKKKT